MVSEWFFVRYADPDDHLRVRFRGVPERLWSDLMPLLCSWASALVTDDLCRGFSFETYERELERYGGPEGMAISESVFSADSRGAVSLLQLQASKGTKLDEMLLSALSTDDLLCALGASAEVRLKVYSALAPNHEGGDAFRKHKMFLRRALEGTELPVSLGIQRVSSLFEKRRDEGYHPSRVSPDKPCAVWTTNARIVGALRDLCSPTSQSVAGSNTDRGTNGLRNAPTTTARISAHASGNRKASQIRQLDHHSPMHERAHFGHHRLD